MKISNIMLFLILTVSSNIIFADPHKDLQKALLCETTKTPGQMYKLTKKLNGHVPLNKNSSFEGEYTFINSFRLFNIPLNKFYIHRLTDLNNQVFYEYSTPFFEESIHEVAKYANLKKDYLTNIYSRRIGLNELSIRIENGKTFLICTQNKLFLKSEEQSK